MGRWNPEIPRHASWAMTSAAASRPSSARVRSHQRALTCAIPISATASSIDSSSDSPASCAMMPLTSAAHSCWAASTRPRTAGSSTRSDSKTSRNAPPSCSTKAK